MEYKAVPLGVRLRYLYNCYLIMSFTSNLIKYHHNLIFIILKSLPYELILE